MRYKPYPKYKESGIEWLGEIPEHWDVTKLRNLGQFTASGIDKKTVKDEPLVKIINFVDVFNSKTKLLKEKDYMLVSATPEKIKAHSVNKGDLIFTPSSETADEIGLSALVDEDLINTAYSYHVLRLKFNTHLNHSYKKYLTNNTFVFNQFSFLARGTTRQTLGRDDFKSIIVSLPPLQEQKTIANYLDKATQKIDTLIQKQEKLTKLLQEKRQALISHAVTKGLNPNVKMKDSGVEWLGEIPEHWKVKKFKYLFKIKKRISGKLGYDILSITQEGIKVKDIESGKGQLSSDYTKYQHVYKGDFAMNHMDLLTGFVDLSKYDGVTSPDYRVFSIIEKNADAYYYLFLLQMGYINKIFYPLGQGSSQFGRWRLPSDAFKEFQAPFPPQEEQEQIAKYIDDRLKKFAKLTEKATKAIELLKERRTALISAVVTGKIDTREEI